MKTYRSYSRRQTPQSEAIPGSSQVANSAGGFAWAVDDWARFKRFLILGCEGGTYYIEENKLTRENAEATERCIAADGPRAVQEILAVSEAGRAPKNDPAIFALALAASAPDKVTRRLAFEALPRVCRIGTHLFHFAAFMEQFRGWGRLAAEGIAHWYTRLTVDALAYQAVKYQERDGWGHRDLLRLSHPKSADHDSLFNWIVNREEVTSWDGLPDIIGAVEIAQRTANPQ